MHVRSRSGAVAVSLAIVMAGCSGGGTGSRATPANASRVTTTTVRLARGSSLRLHAMAYMTSNRVQVPFVVATYAPSHLIVGQDTDVRALFTVIDRPVWVAMNARRVTVPAQPGSGRIEVATDGCPQGAGACNPQPLLTPTARPIAAAPKPGIVVDTGSGLARGGVGLHLSTDTALPGRYEFELTIRYPASAVTPTLLDATGTVRVRLDLATPAPGQNAVCTAADLRRPRPPIPAAHSLQETAVLVHGTIRLDPPPSNVRPTITAAQARHMLADDQAPTGGGRDTLVLASLSETFPRSLGPNGLTRPEITNELAWVIYTHHVAVLPISGPPGLATTTSTAPQASCDFLDGLDAIDARTGSPLGSSGFTSEADPIQF